MFDTAMCYIAYSLVYRQSLGMADQRLTGISHYDLFPNMPDRWRDMHRRCLAGATERGEEAEYRRADGSLSYWQWEMRPWHLPGGQIGGLVLFSRDVTASVQHQRAMQRHTDALNNAGFGICIVDAASNRVSYANPAFAALHGMAPDEVSGMSIFDTYLPGEHGRIREIIAESDRAGHVMFEALRLRRDGTSFLGLTAITGARNDMGAAPAYRVGTVLDITDQRKIRSALEEKEARFQSYIRSAPLCVTVADASGIILEANPAAAIILRSTVETLAGSDFRDLHFAEDAAEVDADFDILRRDGFLQREYRMRRCDGTSFWAVLSAVMLGDGSSIGFLQDVDRLRQAEAARRAAEDDLYAVVQLGPGVLYRVHVAAGRIQLVSVHGDVARISPAFGTDTGSGGMVTSLLQLPQNRDLLQGMALTPDQQEGFIDLPLNPGQSEIRWVRNAVRVTARGPHGADIVGYLSDITREKDEQQRLQRVGTLVTLGEMATGMAHELNQPLASISFAAQNAAFILQRTAPQIELALGKVDKVIAEAKRASDLLDHLKVFARNERRAREPVTWQSALQGALDILGPRRRMFSVRDELPDSLPAVLGERILMEQVLINLIGNAMDAYEAHDAPNNAAAREVTVRGCVMGGQVQLRVADHAGGIRSDVLARVFQPFFTTKASGKGTGLGLALCLGTVLDMGGTLTAQNEDRGAVFEIRLPQVAPVPA